MESQTVKTTEAPSQLVSAVLQQAARRLLSAGIESGALDAEILLGHVLDRRREQIIAMGNTLLDETQTEAYETVLTRRLMREPTAYIIGGREFWSLDLDVTPDVLIPRPETELLVEIALVLLKESPSARARIVDVGTGSGAIAIALASELTNAEIIATDVSTEALSMAGRNAVKNGVAGRIRLAAGDPFAALAPGDLVDLIVSNPPYIRRRDIDSLAPEISRWEPRGALDGGWDGLDYYRRMAAEAPGWLLPGSAIAVEIGAAMSERVTMLFQAAGWTEIETYHDYAQQERVVVARKAGAH
ncbi:MAG TPA: peptide chain release factor N(5)-glutamine methyltransferase [Candidatus Binatia bacterium]|nr:peptide chain release factor N(5)-glutamine methyltransferase [Candidatus Binatia bacterium]